MYSGTSQLTCPLPPMVCNWPWWTSSPEHSPLALYKLDGLSHQVPGLAPIEAAFRDGGWNLTRFDSIRQETMSA